MTNYDRVYEAHLGDRQQQYIALIEQLDLTTRARIPLLYIVAVEEEPVEEVLRQVASRSQPPRQLLFWDIVRGWSDNGADKGSVMAALGRIAKTDSQVAAMFVLRDLHPFLKTPIRRKTRRLYGNCET